MVTSVMRGRKKELRRRTAGATYRADAVSLAAWKVWLVIPAVVASAVMQQSAAASGAAVSGTIFSYAGHPVTVKDLTLVPSARAHALLRTIAASIKKPVGGLWKRELGVGCAAPVGYYTPPRGASRLDVVVHLWRASIENVALRYLSAEVAKALLVKHPCNLSRYYHLRRLHRYLLDRARPFQASMELYARCAAKRWDLRAFASALRREQPGADWAADVIPVIRREPAAYMVAAWCFPVCQGHRVAVSWSALLHVIMTLPAMLKAVRAMRQSLARTVAREVGSTPFFEIRAPAGALKAAAAAAKVLLPLAVPANVRLRRFQLVLAVIGSPTIFEPGGGGDDTTFEALTGLPAGQLSPGKLIPFKQNPHRYLYISTTKPTIAPGFLRVRPPSFLWDAGVEAILKPVCRRVLSRCKPVARWFRKPTIEELLRASTPSVALPHILRRAYRNYRWQTCSPMPGER